MVRLGRPVDVVSEPGPELQGAVHRHRDQHRQAHPRSGKSVAGSHRFRPEAARGRRLRPLPDQERAALLSEHRLDPGRQHPAHHAVERGAAPRAGRGHLHQRGARRTREPDGADPRPARQGGRSVRHPGGRRAYPPRRPAGAEQPGGLQAHADRACSARPQEFRAQGGQKAQEIRSKADREATVIIADANSTAEQTRGVGDAERNRLFAEAYGRDPDFFAFYRSMSAYETGLRSNDTRFLLRPDSEFFRFFANPSGHPPAAPRRRSHRRPAGIHALRRSHVLLHIGAASPA